MDLFFSILFFLYPITGRKKFRNWIMPCFLPQRLFCQSDSVKRGKPLEGKVKAMKWWGGRWFDPVSGYVFFVLIRYLAWIPRHSTTGRKRFFLTFSWLFRIHNRRFCLADHNICKKFLVLSAHSRVRTALAVHCRLSICRQFINKLIYPSTECLSECEYRHLFFRQSFLGTSSTSAYYTSILRFSEFVRRPSRLYVF